MQDHAGRSVLYTQLEHMRTTDTMLVGRLTAAVTAYGGTVVSNTDASTFMAVFDEGGHPERAIRAALAMRDELDALDEETQIRNPTDLRVLINSVDGRAADYPPQTPTDDDTILAKVPPRSVVVSHNTYRFVRGIFDVEAVHGIDPIGDLRDSHYIIVRSRPRQFPLQTRLLAGRETPIVGRTQERAYLTEALHDVLNNHHMRVVSLVGPTGIGKSRIVYEFRNYLELFEAEVYLFQTRCSAETRYLPYGLIRDLLMFRFEIYSSDTAATARRNLERRVQQFIPGQKGEATAHFIGYLIGLDFMYSEHLRVLLDSGQPVHERAIEAVAQYFAAVAADDPAVIIIEGLHHADDASLDALRFIFHSCRGSRLMFVTTGREEVLTRQHHWGEAAHHQVLLIEPLAPEAALVLTQYLLQGTRADVPALHHAIAAHSNGYPLLIEEAALYCMAHYPHSAQPSSLSLPTFNEMVRLRTAQLSAAAQRILGYAACIGTVFWYDALAALVPDLPTEDLEQALLALEAMDFIMAVHPSSFSTTNEYAFRHEGLYLAVQGRHAALPEDHARVANWRISHSAQRVNEYAGILARRYERAERLSQAAEYYIRAAKQADTIAALREAVIFYRKAIELLDTDSISKLSMLLFSLGRVEWQLGEFRSAAVHLEKALHLVEQVGDMLLHAQVLTTLGLVAHGSGQLPAARDYFERSLAMSRSIGDRRAISDNLMKLGELSLDSDDLDLAQACFNESLSIYQTMRHEHRIAKIFLSMSRLSLRKGSFVEAETLAVTTLRIAHRRQSIQLLLETMLILAQSRLSDDPDLATDIVTHVNNHPFVTPLLRNQINSMAVRPAPRATDTAEFRAIIAQFL